MSIGWRSMAGSASALRVLVDTNVWLDLALAREPWASQAKPIWDARDTAQVAVYMPASVLTNSFYVCRRQIGTSQAKAAIAECLRRCINIAVDRTILEGALALAGPDFEDNIQITCAQSASLDLIVTRDASGFAQSPISAIDPAALVARLSQP